MEPVNAPGIKSNLLDSAENVPAAEDGNPMSA